MPFLDNSKLDKSFKTLINKEFSTPAKAFYEEFGANTININTGEVWAENVNTNPATAISAGVARELTTFTLSPVAGFTTSVFYTVSGSGFSPGTTINRASVDSTLLQRNFISDKYGLDYAVKLFDNAGNQIFTTDAIDWFFDYVTGILFIQDPGSFSTPYKVTVYQYIGKTLTSPTLNYSGSFSGSFQGSGAGLSNIPAGGIVGLNLTQIATPNITASVTDSSNIFTVTSASTNVFSINSAGALSGSGANLFNIPAAGIVGLNLSRVATGSVTASVNVGATPFSITSASINLITVDNTSKLTANIFSGSLIGISNTSGSLTGSFTGIGSGSFSGSFQGSGAGLTAIPASGIVGLNLTQIATSNVTASVTEGGTSFTLTNTGTPILTVSNTGTITAAGSASLKDTTVTGSLLVTQNLTVLGTASFTSVTSSIINVGASIITLNTDDPAVRFGGLVVIDSGSFGTSSTGSLLWDSERNHWIYANPSGSNPGQSSYHGGGLMSGPRNTGSLGDETYPAYYSVLRGQGGDHLEGSSIFSSGSNLTINKGTTGSLNGVDILGSVIITGSTLLPSPDGAVLTKYALVTSQSAWHYSDNVGYPAGTNQWNSGLNGSFFNTFTPNTDTATILRFLAGLLSSSAPAPTPNTKTYGSLSNNNPSLSNSSIIGHVPQDISGSDLLYLNSKGFANTGSTIFAGVGTVNTTLNPTYNFSSVSAESTNISSSNDPQLFGLGDKGLTLNVSGTLNFRFDDNFSEISTAVSTSQALLISPATGLLVAEINTPNPAVIPNLFQDGKFFNIFSSTFFNNGRSLTSVSSSGYYHISASIGYATGSSQYQSFSTNFTKVFAAPISNISIPTQTISFTQSLNPATATSRSLSGAPYLQTATFTYSITSSGLFEPLYFGNSTIFSISDDNALVTLGGTLSQVMSAGNISGTSLVFNSTGGTQRTSGTIPFRTDRIQSTNTATFTTTTADTNIGQSTISPTSFNITTTSNNRSGSPSSTGSAVLFHTAGTFGQPVSSGSLAYFGRAQGTDGSTYSLSSGNLVANFTGENGRLQFTDKLLSGSYALGDAWVTTFGLYNLGTSDLQIKPGFLVKPTGSSVYGYWLNDPDTSGTAANLKVKYAAFGFTRNTTGNQPNITMTLAGNTSLSAWTVANPDTVSILIIPQSVLATVSQASGIDPVAAATTTSIGAGTASNPFSRTLTVLANSNPQKTNPFIVDFPTSPSPFPLNGTYQNFVVLVRYIGNPTPLTSITLAVS